MTRTRFCLSVVLGIALASQTAVAAIDFLPTLYFRADSIRGECFFGITASDAVCRAKLRVRNNQEYVQWATAIKCKIAAPVVKAYYATQCVGPYIQLVSVQSIDPNVHKSYKYVIGSSPVCYQVAVETSQ